MYFVFVFHTSYILLHTSVTYIPKEYFQLNYSYIRPLTYLHNPAFPDNL